MTKRKLSGGEAKEPEAAGAKEEEVQEARAEQAEEFAPRPLDVNPLQFLIGSTALSKFTSEYWEQKPLHIPADEERKKFFDGLFSVKELAKIADALEAGAMLLMDMDPGPKGDALSLEDDVDDEMVREVGPLMFGRDVLAVRYIDGKRETIAAQAADSDTLTALHDSAGATLQMHQPQRFVNGLWRLVAALEAQAGCLVGCNAYMTPPGGQGLAPHHDDVELFVCQTQGTKQWRLYKPFHSFELPSGSSDDLPQEELGEPILEVKMQPGDVLYIPRGVVHQAVAKEEGSCHLTLSTYQHWTWGNLAGQLIKTAGAVQGLAAAALPLELRKGLPLGFLYNHGLQAEIAAEDKDAAVAAVRPHAAALAAGLRALAAQLEQGPMELLAPAVDDFAVDFLLNRLPPHPAQLPDSGEEPGAEDSIACRGRNLFRLVSYEASEGSEEEEDEEDEEEDEEEAAGKMPLVQLVTCLANSRYTHMIDADKYELEDEEGDDHHNHEHGMCGIPGCGGSDSEEEEEEGAKAKGKAGKKEEKGEEEEKAKGKAGKKEEKGEEEEKATGAKAKGGKKGGDKEEEGNGAEPEIMEVDEDEEGDSDEGDDSDEDEESDDEEDEERKLQGPVFPAIYTPALVEVLASSLDKPLPVKSLKVPSGSLEEQLRLAQILHESGFVATVQAGKKPQPSPKKAVAEKAKKGAAGKEKEEAKDIAAGGSQVEEGKKDKGKKGGKGKEVEAVAGKADADGTEKAGEGKAKEGAKEKVSPPAKKAKKGGK